MGKSIEKSYDAKHRILKQEGSEPETLLCPQFLTHGEKPSGPPRNVRITGLSSTSLEVTWDDPEKRLMNGPVTRYSLGYREYK